MNPSNRETIAEVANGTPDDVEAAVTAASGARDGWASTSPARRSQILYAVARGITDNFAELSELECSETGKPANRIAGEINGAAAYFEYYAAVVRTMEGATIEVGPQQHTYVRHEPYGLIAVITPWNAPLNQASRSIAPALAAGNVVVAKPSEFTSASTVRLAQIASEAGLPDGVLNVVTGTGPAVGAALANHAEVRRIVFTGSVPTGRFLGHVAAERVIPVTLELGGKSPMVVFEDAALDKVAQAAVGVILLNAGQVCSATTRILVQRSVHDRLVEMIAAGIGRLVPGKDFGPIITEPQYARVLDYFAVAAEEGATLVVGGLAYPREDVGNGLYVRPTVYTGVTPSMRIAREEIFGPVLVVIPFDDEADALAIANDTDYGLAASVWTGNVARGLRLAERIEAGQVSINGGGLGIEAPFGGYKQSGIGREKGSQALAEYSQMKTISVALPA